ncbi:DUF6093 family protein [Streptomyces sp. ID05-39B]|uniref:DUF6093 family protein n=1 Tax=Streptomyces sp. ID05-39B TaxID=3028664 RepID=UPI0029A24E6B|nr:DUF6093 family protein [Streptomyces sp. ID05-39B]MDX3527142.1 DUF6093 family protein [Streptomyces sp. ID05-39B]
MAGLDLSGVAVFLEGFLLLDTLRFSRAGTGEPVFNNSTGLYEYPDLDPYWEGKGAVLPSSTVGGVTGLSVESLPWSDETRSRYRAFTPLSAPVAERGMIVTVVQVHEGGDLELLTRQWLVQDPSAAGTFGALRITGLDQVQQTRQAG